MNSRLMEYFKCPVCQSFIIPPVFLCSGGHAMCADCCRKVKRCPVCKTRKGGINNLLENQLMILRFPCEYSSNGCEYTSISYFLKKHETNCEHMTRRCPFHEVNFCKWKGVFKNIKRHIFLDHGRHVFLESSPDFTIYGALQKTYQYNRFVLVQYDTIFLMDWEFDTLTDLFKFSVCYYECPFRNKKFSYTIFILEANTSRMSYSVSANCRYSTENAMLMGNKDYIYVPFVVARKCMDKEGDVRFTVKITDHKAEIIV